MPAAILHCNESGEGLAKIWELYLWSPLAAPDVGERSKAYCHPLFSQVRTGKPEGLGHLSLKLQLEGYTQNRGSLGQ